MRSSLYMRGPLLQVSTEKSNIGPFAWENHRMRKGVKRALGLGVLAGAAYAAWRAFEKSRPESTLTWQPRPFPYPPEPVETPARPPSLPTTPTRRRGSTPPTASARCRTR